ncbi:hypothetical protein H072_5239 [Dactylellina haptotyla CBS 200.50]|uniref:Uncharacterized protein n=1 Tax=Dactylellina haptotyla (strain CBS 200.50) TaxID=1284197 RepID=S8AD22_DACHA|nr:hypothetical protein H072_5239 [Dactylellina haptotyla CBS 200.50]
MLSRSVLHAVPRRNTSSLLRRRYATAHSESHSAGHSTAHHSTSAGETIPTWFFVSVGGIVATYALYAYILPTETSALTRWLSPDSATRKAQEEISNRHTAFIEQAARDKHLLLGDDGSPTVPMRFPERITMHSPLNLPAGHTRGLLMDELEEFYRKENPPK